MVLTGKTYVVDGFEIKQVQPAAFYLVLIWKFDKQSHFPAMTHAQALECRHKISLRPEMMQRIEVRERQAETGQVIWDADWNTLEYTI